MAEIKNMGNMTIVDLHNEIAKGGKFVIFQYTISIVVMTFKRPSAIYFIPSHGSAFRHSWHLSLLTLVLGWWGIPWGPIYTIGSLASNLSGGKDITNEVMAQLAR